MVEKYIDPNGQYRIVFKEGIFSEVVVQKNRSFWKFIYWNTIEDFTVICGDIDEAYTDAINFTNQHKKLFPEVK